MARDARRHLELSRRRQDRRDRGARFPCRADDHQPAGRRVSDCRALSGVARAKSAPASTRSMRAAAISPSSRRRRKSSLARRTMQTHRHRRRRGDGSPDSPGQRRAAVDRRVRSIRRPCAARSRTRSPISKRSTTCTPPPPIAAASPPCWPRAPSPMRWPMRKGANPMHIELTVNGTLHELDVEPRTTLLDCLRDTLGLKGAHAGCEHGVCGACTVLFDGAAVRSCLMFAAQAAGSPITTIEGVTPGPGELSPIQDAFCETHGMQCGYCTPAMILAAHALLADNPEPTREDIVEAISGNLCRCTGYAQIVEAIALAAERMRGVNRPRSMHQMSAPRPPSATSPPTAACARTAALSPARAIRRRYRLAQHEARRAGDLPARGGAHQDRSTRRGALKMPGVHYVLDGAELAAATLPLMTGLDTPNVPRRPLAFETARYSGEWVAAVVADTPRARRRRRRSGRDRLRAAALRARRRTRRWKKARRWCTRRTAPMCCSTRLSCGARSTRISPPVPRKLSLRVKWGRSSTVPIETFGVVASWDPWREMLDVYASIQMPRYADQIGAALKIPATSVRVHHDVDVGGSYGVKRGIKHTVLCRLPGAPARLSGAADRGPAGKHARRRRARAGAAVRRRGRLRRQRHRALDEDARAGKCRRLCRPLAVPARQADRRHRRALQDQERASIAPSRCVTNKTTQDAVRGFGQGPTNLALERAMDEVANVLGLDPLEVRRRNLIRHDEFPYLIPSGTTYDSGNYRDRHRQGAGRHRLRRAQGRARPAARAKASSPASASPPASSRPAATPPSRRCSIRRSPPRPSWIPAASTSTASAPSPPPCTPPRPARATRRWSAP